MAAGPSAHIEDGSAVPCRLNDQEFGMGLTPGDNFNEIPLTSRSYDMLWGQMPINDRDVGCTIHGHKEKFQVDLDVKHFAPEGISVKKMKTATGVHVIIKGQHEEKEDEHGLISRQFIRRFILPPNYDRKTLKSKLSPDGVLTVTALRMTPESRHGKNVPIAQTGPVMEENQDGTAQQISQTDETNEDANGTDK